MARKPGNEQTDRRIGGCNFRKKCEYGYLHEGGHERAIESCDGSALERNRAQ